MERNKNLADAVKLLNKIEPDKLAIVFTRILTQNTADVSKLFTEREKDKFIRLFGMTEESFTNVINALYFLSLQAAFDKNFKIAENQLSALGLSSDHITELQGVWTDNAGVFVNNIKEKPIAIDKVLTNFSWSIKVPFQEGRLPVQEKLKFKEGADLEPSDFQNLYDDDVRNPQVFMSFFLGDSSQGGKKEDFVVKMNKTDVQDIFDQLELVQTKIDSLM